MKDKFDIAVIGSGGREHAVIKQLKASSKCGKLYCLPGNAGIAEDAEIFPVKAMDFDGIVAFCKEKAVDICFVAPDDPLGAGLVDLLKQNGIRAFGPVAKGARLEGSKAFSKTFMKKYGIPTADYNCFTDADKALEYVKEAKLPLVVKADGLALGKGVLICNTRDEAVSAVREIMIDKTFGAAGDEVVIEEFLEGREVTLLAFCDGKTIRPMPSSQDHKRAFDGDKGLNTGGMGAFSPSRLFTADVEDEVQKRIVEPTLRGFSEEGIDFCGVIYFGLMLTKDGAKVLEYNARFGDPETQAVLPLLETDFIDVINACIDGKLGEIEINWKNSVGFCVVIASGGYPENVKKGFPIEIGDLEGVTLFHAGTKRNDDGTLVTNGGRVFAVSTVSDSIENARKTVYSQIDKVRFEGARYRSDIGIK